MRERAICTRPSSPNTPGVRLSRMWWQLSMGGASRISHSPSPRAGGAQRSVADDELVQRKAAELSMSTADLDDQKDEESAVLDALLEDFLDKGADLRAPPA